MQQQGQQSHQRHGKSSKFTFRAVVDGHSGRFTATAIPETAWKTNSGVAPDGTQVHSLDTATFGNTTIVRKLDGSMKAYKTADLLVLGIGMLVDAGCTIAGPNGATLGQPAT